MIGGSGSPFGYSSWPRWDGRKLVPMGKRAQGQALAQRGTFRESVSPNHDAGLGPTHPKETMMKFYTQQHRFYCGIDLHARTISVHTADPWRSVWSSPWLTHEDESVRCRRLVQASITFGMRRFGRRKITPRSRWVYGLSGHRRVRRLPPDRRMGYGAPATRIGPPRLSVSATPIKRET